MVKKKGKPRGKPFAKGEDPRRHSLSKAERQKGYLHATQLVKMPSRVRVWLRNKLRRAKIKKSHHE